MTTTILGKKLMHEGDDLLKRGLYNQSLEKYLKCHEIGYFGGIENRLIFISDNLNNEEENIPDIETLIKVGEILIYSGGCLHESKAVTLGYFTLLNFVPEEDIPRETRMYMNYLSDMNL